MNQANKWAKKRYEKYLDLNEVDERRPRLSPEFFAPEFKWAYIKISDFGNPIICVPEFNVEIEIKTLEYKQQLLDIARWYIEMFEDKEI